MGERRDHRASRSERSRRHLLFGPILALGLVGAAAVPASAEFCRPAMPDHAADVRGATFDALVVSIEDETDLTWVTLAVSTVWADGDDARLRDGATIRLPSNACDGFGLLGFRAGNQILVSTAALHGGDGPATWNTAVWRRADEEISLLVLQGLEFDRVWFTDDRRIAEARTTADALALVAPDALPVPHTAIKPDAAGTDPTLAVIAVMVLAGSVGVLVRFRPRAR